MDKLLRNKKAIIIFMAPALILFTFILFIPICQSVYYSFCDYNALTPPKFVGLKNYQALIGDKTLKIALKNSVFFLIYSCVTQLIMGLFLAALLTNIDKGRNLFKNIIYLPCVLSSAALGLLWMFIFSPKLGINQLLEKIGMEALIEKQVPEKNADPSAVTLSPIFLASFISFCISQIWFPSLS